jgi:tetrahydromethanopterin S-methyltransferase subunit B
MAGNRTLKLSILADVDDLKKKLGQGEKEVEGFGNKLGEFGKKAAAAFAVAAAAAAAYAGKLLIDGVKAAIEDEKAQVKLAQTLENTTGATREQIKAVEDQILKMSLATGIADDKLRPSFEKLVRATNDVAQAQKLQTLALDIAAGSGKDLEAVSVALAKAYDGNNTSLQRLGVGLSAAELKSMSFDDVTKSLAETFGGQASVQADTFSGKMARMQVAFDEAKESVGARLLPILTQLLDTFNTKVGPAVQAIQDKLKPLTKAIEDNKEEFTALWNFLNKYIVPIMAGALKNAFSGIVTGITAVVNIVGKAVNFFQDLYSAYKKFVDFIKNNPLSQFLGKINPFSNSSFSNAAFENEGLASDFGTVSSTIIPSGNFSNPFAPSVPFVPTQQYLDAIARRRQLEEETAAIRQRIANRKAGITTLDTGNQGITINVNAPSAIDSEGFTRSVIQALNESQQRTGSLDTLTV